MRKSIIYISLISLITISCKTTNNSITPIQLTGRHVIWPRAHTSLIYNDCYLQYKILTNQNAPYYLTWFNTKNSFLAYQDVKCSNLYYTRLVVLDSIGQITDSIFKTSYQGNVSNYFLSPTDTKLVFSASVDNGCNTYYLYYPITLYIMDFNTRNIIKKFENLCPDKFFAMYENPWSKDENSFVYTIRKRDKHRDESYIPSKTDSEYLKMKYGVYVYNIAKDTHKLLAENASGAVWSPSGKYIAYRKNKKIWIYDVEDKKHECIYRLGYYEDIYYIHWTPDGDYLYVSALKVIFDRHLYRKLNEYLFDMKDKKSVPFNKPGLDYSYFSWARKLK